jgi:hypothetical protein
MARCAWLLLHDLCLLSSGEHSLYDSLWLKLSAQLPIAVALELLEAILTQNQHLLQTVPPFVQLLRLQVSAHTSIHRSAYMDSFSLHAIASSSRLISTLLYVSRFIRFAH